MAEPWTAEDMRGIEVDELLLRIGPLKDCCCTWQAIPCGAHRQASRALDAVLAGRDATLDAVRADRAALLAVARAARSFAEEIQEDHPAIDRVRLRALNAALDALEADPRVRALLEGS